MAHDWADAMGLMSPRPTLHIMSLSLWDFLVDWTGWAGSTAGLGPDQLTWGVAEWGGGPAPGRTYGRHQPSLRRWREGGAPLASSPRRGGLAGAPSLRRSLWHWLQPEFVWGPVGVLFPMGSA